MAIFMAVILLLVCHQAQAHKVSVFAWIEGDTVHVESKFSGGRKAVAAPVEVYDSQGNLLLKGVTDDAGTFTFKVPQKTEMKVVLLAGMGHKGEWTIPLSDLGDVKLKTPSTTSQFAPQQPPATVAEGTESDSSTESNHTIPTANVTADEIRRVVEAALDEKLKPVMKSLADMHQSGPSTTDILGGVGTIFGLIGVAAYIRSKRRKS